MVGDTGGVSLTHAKDKNSCKHPYSTQLKVIGVIWRNGSRSKKPLPISIGVQGKSTDI